MRYNIDKYSGSGSLSCSFDFWGHSRLNVYDGVYNDDEENDDE